MPVPVPVGGVALEAVGHGTAQHMYTMSMSMRTVITNHHDYSL